LKARTPPELAEVSFDNDRSGDYTILRVETDDRVGLLSDLLECLTDCGLNIAQAIIDTQDDLARDTFFLSEANGHKILNLGRLRTVKKQLLTALGAGAEPE
jgi:UTP:GlnB (protein PII) uridylyltransferase